MRHKWYLEIHKTDDFEEYIVHRDDASKTVIAYFQERKDAEWAVETWNARND